MFPKLRQSITTRNKLYFIGLAAILTLHGCASSPPTVTYGEPEDTPPVVTPAQRETSPTREIFKPVETTPTPTTQRPGVLPLLESIPVSPPEQSASTSYRKYYNIKYIEQRLAAYEKKLQQWLELQPETSLPTSFDSPLFLDPCLTQFDLLLSGYANLLKQLRTKSSAKSQEEIIPDLFNIFQKDIRFLEGGCEKRGAQSLTPTTGSIVRDADSLTATDQAEQLISEYFSRAEFEEVLSLYQIVTASYPDFTPLHRTTEQYGLSLLHTGDLEAATEVFLQILAIFKKNYSEINPWVLQRMTANLLLATGRPDEAKELYNGLLTSSDVFSAEYSWASRQTALLAEVDSADLQMTYYIDLLRAALIFNNQRHKPIDLFAKADDLIQIFPDTPVADSANQIKKQIENQLIDWIDQQLKTVEDLVQKKEFQQAQAALAAMSQEHLPAQLQIQVQEKIKEVELTVELEMEAQRLLLEQSLAVQWESSITLFDAERYDAAIQSFETLLETDYADQAKQKIQEATNLAAADKRKQAASLFIKAIKARNRGDKKELLLESRGLLQEIMTKYPHADIIDKAAQNLETLEKHITQFDPSLLEELENESAETLQETHMRPDQIEDLQSGGSLILP